MSVAIPTINNTALKETKKEGGKRKKEKKGGKKQEEKKEALSNQPYDVVRTGTGCDMSVTKLILQWKR